MQIIPRTARELKVNPTDPVAYVDLILDRYQHYPNFVTEKPPEERAAADPVPQ